MSNNSASPGGPELPGELLWNIKTVIQKTGLSRATIYRYTRRNLFPQKRRIGPNRVGWLAAEIIAWVATLPHLRSKFHWARVGLAATLVSS